MKKRSDPWTRLLAQLGRLPRRRRTPPHWYTQAAQFEARAACSSTFVGG